MYAILALLLLGPLAAPAQDPASESFESRASRDITPEFRTQGARVD